MPLLQDGPQVEWVSEDIIRRIFNEEGLLDEIREGRLIEHVKRSSHPNPPPTGEPLCTFSQIVYYYSPSGQPRALVHRYLRPDGNLGASGMPDPKRLFLADRIVSVKTRSSC